MNPLITPSTLLKNFSLYSFKVHRFVIFRPFAFFHVSFTFMIQKGSSESFNLCSNFKFHLVDDLVVIFHLVICDLQSSEIKFL